MRKRAPRHHARWPTPHEVEALRAVVKLGEGSGVEISRVEGAPPQAQIYVLLKRLETRGAISRALRPDPRSGGSCRSVWWPTSYGRAVLKAADTILYSKGWW